MSPLDASRRCDAQKRVRVTSTQHIYCTYSTVGTLVGEAAACLEDALRGSSAAGARGSGRAALVVIRAIVVFFFLVY